MLAALSSASSSLTGTLRSELLTLHNCEGGDKGEGEVGNRKRGTKRGAVKHKNGSPALGDTACQQVHLLKSSTMREERIKLKHR